MTSFVWNRDPQEAYENPYEYEAQSQFHREAIQVLDGFHLLLDRYNLRFSREDQSTKKAVWMLQYDALDAIQDSLESLHSRKHKIAGRLFRDAWETLELASYFSTGTSHSQKDLSKWFGDRVVSNAEVREQHKKFGKESVALGKAKYYSQLSKLTHRTYRTLLKGYGLGRNDLLVNESHSRHRDLALPQTISGYYPVLASLIKHFSFVTVASGVATQEEVDSIWEHSFEKDTVPRRFAEQ
jgi:hypothetical protein